MNGRKDISSASTLYISAILYISDFISVIITSVILFMLLLLPWMVPVAPSLCSLRRQICALVVPWLLSFVTRCHNSRSVPLILLFLLENRGLLDNRWLFSLWGAPAKTKEAAVRLTVVFLNSGKGSSQNLTPIYSGCANLITFSPQPCFHLKVCHNADFFFLPPHNKRKEDWKDPAKSAIKSRLCTLFSKFHYTF